MDKKTPQQSFQSYSSKFGRVVVVVVGAAGRSGGRVVVGGWARRGALPQKLASENQFRFVLLLFTAYFELVISSGPYYRF